MNASNKLADPGVLSDEGQDPNRTRPDDRDWQRGHETARKRNAEILEPIDDQGHWEEYDKDVHDLMRVDTTVVRTLRFDGFDEDTWTMKFVPGSVYIWMEGLSR